MHDLTAVPDAPEFRLVRESTTYLGSTALRIHLLVPLACLSLLAVWAGSLGGDRWLADSIYAWEGHSWALREAWITDTAIHVYGRRLSAAAWTALLCVWMQASLFRPRWPMRRPVAYLLLAVLASCVAVFLIKSWSNMDCPWDLVRYGGQREFFGLTEARPPGMERGRCFPAGHASAGYAWVALYFFFLTVAPRWRWPGLATGLALGLVFGVSQQLRGAHFLSHDLYTAGICWLIALGLYATMLRASDARGRTPAAGDGPP